MACFTLHGTCIGKTYLLKYPPSAQLRTAVDASPGGLGGVLHQGCTPARWFADPITQLTKISSQQNKSPQFNPLWEALAICVSLCVDRMMRRARISHDSLVASDAPGLPGFEPKSPRGTFGLKQRSVPRK